MVAQSTLRGHARIDKIPDYKPTPVPTFRFRTSRPLYVHSTSLYMHSMFFVTDLFRVVWQNFKERNSKS